MRLRTAFHVSVVVAAVAIGWSAWAPKADATTVDSLAKTLQEFRASSVATHVAKEALTIASTSLDRAESRRRLGQHEQEKRARLVADAALRLVSRKVAVAELEAQITATKKRIAALQNESPAPVTRSSSEEARKR